MQWLWRHSVADLQFKKGKFTPLGIIINSLTLIDKASNGFMFVSDKSDFLASRLTYCNMSRWQESTNFSRIPIQ